MVTGLLGGMNDQRHPTQQPARRQAKDQRPQDSNPRPHRKKRVSIRTGQMSQLLWEVALSPGEVTEAFCLYFVHPKPSFAASFTSKGKEEEEKQNKPN